MENNFKYIVYQTININNNKIYIGVHRVRNVDVFDGYVGCGVNIYYPSTYMNPKTPFLYAVKKYGTSSFRRSTLYVFDNEEDAYNKESEIVSKEFINRHDTYNACLGGQLPIHALYNKIYQFDREGKLVKIWDNVYDVCEFFETWKLTIYAAIGHKLRIYNFYWSYEPQINIEEFSSPNECRKVYKYSKDGKCVAIYNSIGEAARVENVLPGHIINNVKAGSLTNGEFYFSYELYDEYIQKPRLDLKNKYLYLYDLDGNYVKEIFIKNFKKEYDVHTYKEISNCILNEASIKGFLIRIEKFEKINPYIPKNKRKSVIVYKLDGTEEKEFDSVTSACKEYGFDRSTVSKILRGCSKSTKGYTIKYKN